MSLSFPNLGLDCTTTLVHDTLLEISLNKLCFSQLSTLDAVTKVEVDAHDRKRSQMIFEWMTYIVAG